LSFYRLRFFPDKRLDWHELKPMEKQKLLARWHILLNETGDAAGMRGILQERLVILHRLNELGVYELEGLSLVKALEATNELVWKTDKAASLASPAPGTHL
jgi:hypothetical protein